MHSRRVSRVEVFLLEYINARVYTTKTIKYAAETRMERTVTSQCSVIAFYSPRSFPDFIPRSNLMHAHTHARTGLGITADPPAINDTIVHRIDYYRLYVPLPLLWMLLVINQIYWWILSVWRADFGTEVKAGAVWEFAETPRECSCKDFALTDLISCSRMPCLPLP